MIRCVSAYLRPFRTNQKVDRNLIPLLPRRAATTHEASKHNPTRWTHRPIPLLALAKHAMWRASPSLRRWWWWWFIGTPMPAAKDTDEWRRGPTASPASDERKDVTSYSFDMYLYGILPLSIFLSMVERPSWWELARCRHITIDGSMLSKIKYSTYIIFSFSLIDCLIDR